MPVILAKKNKGKVSIKRQCLILFHRKRVKTSKSYREMPKQACNGYVSYQHSHAFAQG